MPLPAFLCLPLSLSLSPSSFFQATTHRGKKARRPSAREINFKSPRAISEKNNGRFAVFVLARFTDVRTYVAFSLCRFNIARAGLYRTVRRRARIIMHENLYRTREVEESTFGIRVGWGLG